MPDFLSFPPRSLSIRARRTVAVVIVLLASLVGMNAASVGAAASAQEPAGLSAKLTRMDGSESSVTLVAVEAERIELLDSSGTPSVLPIAEVARIDFEDAAATAEPGRSVEATLVDGTLLRGSDATLVDDRWTVVSGSRRATVDRRDLAWLAVIDPARPAIAPTAWEEVLAETPTADRVVVARVEEGNVRLTVVEGVIGGLSEQGAAFRFDDREVTVGFDRLAGLVPYHPPGRRLGSVAASVDLIDGSRIPVRSWEAMTNGVRWRSVGGVDLEVPLAEVRSIDFQAGRVLSLVDLEPTTSEWTPFISGGDVTPEAQQSLSSLFAMERNLSFSGEALTLESASGFGSGEAVRTFSRGLALRSRTRLVYRVPEGYSRLVGWMGIDPKSRPRGDVLVVIEGDGRTLWEGRITGADPEPVRLDVEIGDIARLAVRIDFSEGGDLGDRLHWCEPRLVK